MDFLKNEDSSYHKQFFDDPVSNLEVTYSDLTNVPAPGKSRLTDLSKLNYSNEYNSNEGNNKLTPLQNRDRTKSEQMNDSLSMKTSKLNSLLGNMQSKLYQNEKPDTEFGISRKDDTISSKKEISDKRFPNYEGSNKSEEKEPQLSEKIISVKQFNELSESQMKQQNKRKTNSLRESKNLSLLNDKSDLVQKSGLDLKKSTDISDLNQKLLSQLINEDEVDNDNKNPSILDEREVIK